MVKNILLRFLFVILAVMLVFCDCLSVNIIRADSDIGALIDSSGNETKYNDFDKLRDALKDNYKGRSVTIEMYTDWDASKNNDFDERLYIPKNCNATFNMHGHMFNRDSVRPSWWEQDVDGELIFVENGATLTINGFSDDSEKTTQHSDIRVFTDVNQKYAEYFESFDGALLCGGNGIYGTGGIYIDSGKTVTLNNVTIAGCKAYYNKGTSVFNSGLGAGVIITEPNSKLVMNNSRITGCLAEDDGGGIYGDSDENITIELNNSTIDYNFANSDGGGINMDGENATIICGKTGKSSISNNKAVEIGGGVYLWNDGANLTGNNGNKLTIDGNKAEKGGGVFVEEEDSKLSDLIITNNEATDKGGGVFINNDYVTINSCQITNNKKIGVYVEEYCDEGVTVSGATVIKDNEGITDKAKNLVLNENYAYVNFKQSDGMDVHIGYYDYDKTYSKRITYEACPDYSNQLIADDSDYSIVYTYDENKLFYTWKASPYAGAKTRVNPDIVEIKTQDAHAYSAGKVYSGLYTESEGGSGTQYQLRRFYIYHCSTGDRNLEMFYSDGFFFEDPVLYNDHLATASYGMASAGAYLNNYEYEYKHAGARQFMADIGCPDQMIYVNDGNTTKPGTDTIGVTFGSKTLQKYDGDNLVSTGYTLIAIATRGANYEKEWASNVTLDYGDLRDGEARGFSEAADQVMEALEYYLDRYELRDEIENGKVKFWISGFSRGGATANIVSKRILEEYCYRKDETQSATGNQVFSYPMEAPQGGTDKAEKLNDKQKYFCIHNLVNTGDIVTFVGPKEMGFKRYGVDHYMPGTHLGRMDVTDYLEFVEKSKNVYTPEGASAVSGITSVTTYCDNEPLSTKSEKDHTSTISYKEYRTRRNNLIDHLAVIDHTMLFFDYFMPYATSISDFPPFKKLGLFDGAKLEDFLPNFMAFLQQQALKSDFRVKYVNELQPLARAYFAAESDKEAKKRVDVLMDAVDKVIHSDPVTYSLIINVIGEYYDIDEKGKKYVIDYLWDTASVNGAFDDLTDEEIKVIRNYWDILLDLVFTFTDSDWQLGNNGIGNPVFPTGVNWVNGKYGSESGGDDSWLANKLIYTLTMYFNVNMMIDNNHSREIGIAWARTYDSYYSQSTDYNSQSTDNGNVGKLPNEKYVEYDVHWVKSENKDNYIIDIPRAYIKTNGQTKPYQELKEASEHPGDVYNEVVRNQKIILEIGKINEGVSPTMTIDQEQGTYDVLGEAIYYKIYDADREDATPLVGEQLYRGGMYLPVPETEEGGNYRVEAYGRSLGLRSETSVYYFHVNVGHKVTVDNGSGGTAVTHYYKDGEQVSIAADPKDNTYFDVWKVELLDINGEVVKPDIAADILNGMQKDVTVSFTMPSEGTVIHDGEESTYPDGYALRISALCNNMVKQVTTGSDYLPAPAPVIGEDHGQSLVSVTTLSFDNGATAASYPVTWTYKFNGKTYPATETVYSNVDYIATINIPKNQANKIVFAPSGVLSAVYRGATEKIKEDGVSIIRNDADGSATLVVQFKTTKDGGDRPPQDEPIDIQVKAFDLNMSNYIPGTAPVVYSVYRNSTVTITAPDVEDEIFVMWSFDSTKTKGIVPAEETPDLTSKTIKVRIPSEITGDPIPVIDAQYIPVINNISAVIAAPEAGKTMQTEADENTLKVIISNQYQIHPDYVDIIWSPLPVDGKADYLTRYTVTVKLSPKTDAEGSYIYAKKIGAEGYTRTSAIFNYSENPTVTINDNKAQLDKNNNSISYTFPMTNYYIVKVYQPEEVTGVKYGATVDEIKSHMPTVEILLNDGRTMTASVNWDTPHRADDSKDQYSSHVWMSDGVVQLPYGVENKDGISLNVVGKVVVDAAESVKRAVPSTDPGVYWNDETLTLSCETEDAVIYYTTDPDATDDYTRWNVYKGETISINRADAKEDEIGPDGKPTGRKKISLRTVAYKEGMRPDGPRTYAYIFANGVDAPEGYDYVYDGKEHAGVHGSGSYTLEAISEGVTIDDQGNAVAVEVGRYMVKAKINDGLRWRIINPDTKEVSYTTDDLEIMFIISEDPSPREEYTITYDLNEGWNKITETYTEGTTISIRKAPKRPGYIFLYWQGSIHYPGDPYLVTEDHTFTAVWKKDEPVPPYVPPRTGDQ